MKRYVDEGRVAGIVALIGRRSGTDYVEAFGMRDRGPEAPMTKDALFRVYSMTKPITAAAALILFDEAKFALDDPISDRLPEWKEVKVGAAPARRPITVRDLMRHSSGLAYPPV
jgi:CubicO group peptidase (beta-lactamase class C family)